MVIWVVGFPHTATTFVYKTIYRLTLFGVFEPFNPFVRLSHLLDGRHVHYSEGEVPDDFDKLSSDAKQYAYEASMLVLGATRCRFNRSRFEEAVIEFTKVTKGLAAVVKDVSAWWVLLRRAAELDIPMIVTVRDRDAVYGDFARISSVWTGLKSFVANALEAHRHPCHMGGLGIFAQALGIEVRHTVGVSLRSMRKLFDRLYYEYEKLAEDAEASGRVTIIRFGERLGESEVVKTVKELLRTPSR